MELLEDSYLKDGVHLSAFGQVKLHRSIRGAVLHSLRTLHLLKTANVSGVLLQLQFIYLVSPHFTFMPSSATTTVATI